MDKKKNRIKKRKSGKQKIKIPLNNTQPKLDYPVFCFKHLTLNYQGDDKFYYNFIIRLTKLSKLSWSLINTTQKHSFGTEKIPVSQIKPSLPNFVTPEVTHLIVFRASGDNRPFLGLRNQNIFHVILIEEKFGDVYNHN